MASVSLLNTMIYRVKILYSSYW